MSAAATLAGAIIALVAAVMMNWTRWLSKVSTHFGSFRRRELDSNVLVPPYCQVSKAKVMIYLHLN